MVLCEEFIILRLFGVFEIVVLHKTPIQGTRNRSTEMYYIRIDEFKEFKGNPSIYSNMGYEDPGTTFKYYSKLSHNDIKDVILRKKVSRYLY